MTETRFTWRWIFVVGVLGACLGIAAGIGAGWLFPISSNSGTGVSALKADDQNQYIILVANSYALDGDLQLARDRLAELHDPNIKTRVERLAKTLSSKQDPDAPNVADLAVALGSNDTSLRVMAGNVAKRTNSEEPTKVARIEVLPSDTPQPTDTPTEQPTDAPTATATKAKAVAAVPKPTSTPKPPAPTAAPQAAPPPPAAPQPLFQPDLGNWYSSQYIPASVPAGQQYWRLVYARYCDWVPEERFNPCPNMPGGIMDHTIYVMALDPSGNCASSPTVQFDINDGSTALYGPDKAKQIAFPWYNSPCMTDYEKEMYGEGNSVSIQGFPSDKITNLVLCGKNPPPGYEDKVPLCGHAHVHYFLVFQQTTR